jgi:hypothetical protein
MIPEPTTAAFAILLCIIYLLIYKFKPKQGKTLLIYTEHPVTLHTWKPASAQIPKNILYIRPNSLKSSKKPKRPKGGTA